MQKALQTPGAFDLYRRSSNALGIGDYSNRIIHYTTEEALGKIIETNSLLFGSISQMNDTTECDHFLDHVLENSHRLLGSVDLPGLQQLITNLRPAIRDQTYVSSWCEYFESEPNGKLSMWRAYGDNGLGVGLVVDSAQLQPSALTAQKIGFHVYSTKVEYVRDNRAVELANNYLRRIASMPENAGALQQRMQMAIMLLAKAPCVKHIGFEEEEEVRFLYMKGLNHLLGGLESSERIVQIGEPPHKREYYVFPLDDYDQFGFDLRIGSVLRRVIVGPAGDAAERAARITQMLKSHMLGHVEVLLSKIPLR